MENAKPIGTLFRIRTPVRRLALPRHRRNRPVSLAKYTPLLYCRIPSSCTSAAIIGPHHLGHALLNRLTADQVLQNENHFYCSGTWNSRERSQQQWPS